MMAIYRRLGIPAAGNHVRYVKVLRIDRTVEKYIPGKFLARGISQFGNLVLKFQRPRYLPSGVEVSIHEGPFGEEFTALDTNTADSNMIRVLRTAEYLNWRYRQNPFNRYQVAVARRGSQLLGYAVLEMNGLDCILSDLHAIDEANTIPGILAFLDHLTTAFNVDSISTPIMEGAALVRYLHRAGYFPREGLPVVACVGDVKPPHTVQKAQNWFLMHGDRES